MSTFVPHEEKRRLGNPSKRSLPEVVNHQPPVKSEDAAKSPLDLMESVIKHGAVWLGATDAIALALLRELLTERQEVKALIDAGDAATPRWELRKIDAQIMKMLTDLGFNPVARSKIGLSEVQAASTLDNLRNKQQK